MVGWRFPLGFDETVYVSQLAHAPTLEFTAQRARGVPLLIAPITAFTSSLVALRMWCVVLCAVGWYCAWRPWQRLVEPRIVVVAAALNLTLWVSIYYGDQAMPNMFVAIGAVLGAGYVGRWREQPRTGLLVVAALAVSVVALMRPVDGAALLVALSLATLSARVALRRRVLAVSWLVLAGVAGSLEWLIEAEVRFGGVRSRLSQANAIVDSGVHWALGLQARVIAGPIVCRGPCSEPYHPWALAGWVVGAALVGVAIWVARHSGKMSAYLIAVLTAVAMSIEYFVDVDFAVPRFLLPAYGLLALPAAAGLLSVVGWLRRLPSASWRRVGIAGVAGLLAAHVALQLFIVRDRIMPLNRLNAHRWVEAAHALRDAGVRGRCLVIGADHAPIAYAAGCTDDASSPHDSAALVTRTTAAPPPYNSWRLVTLQGPDLAGWYAFVRTQDATGSTT